MRTSGRVAECQSPTCDRQITAGSHLGRGYRVHQGPCTQPSVPPRCGRLTSSNLHKMDYAEGKGVTARCGRGVVHGSPSQQLPTRELRIGDVHRPVGDSLHLDERLSFFLPLRRTLASISGGIFRESTSGAVRPLSGVSLRR